ncbi:MAG TPA: apolipoprotein N-acyltransferase [Blastocatellia bacterium]|nr:apolipoprotein N-acyltransferase [Blastocatellia bacterium]
MKERSAFIVHRSASVVQRSEEALPPAYAREDFLAARLRVARVLPYQLSRAPFVSNLMLAISSGLLLVFAFPDWGLWSLAWVGTAPLIMAVVRAQRFWRCLLLGTITGTIFYVGSSSWVTYSMHNYGDVPLWLSYILATVAALVLGLFTGSFAALLAFLVKRLGGWAMLAAPLIWPASELARIQVTGMGWNALGYSQAFQPAVIQVARWGGVYAVSAMLVAASAALVFAVVYLERRRGLVVFMTTGVVVIAAVVYGASIRPVVQSERAAEASLTVAVVQPNVPVAGDWSDPRFVDSLVARHFFLSEQALRAAAVQVSSDTQIDADARRNAANSAFLIVWPESPMNWEYERDEALRSRVEEFTRKHGAYLLMNSWGFPQTPAAGSVVYNSAILIGPSGELISRYDKLALMPFGEYVPARGVIPFMDRVPALVQDVTAGASLRLSEAGGAKIGTPICFEATRPELVRRMRREGASVLVQLSNESWFGPSAVSRQMLAHAVLRAVENDVSLIRATNSGGSVWVDRYGQPHDETQRFETATRGWKAETADEANVRPLTFYARYGDVFAAACAVVSAVLTIAALVPKRSRGSEV